MSEVALSAFAPVPSESNFEGLTKKLLALRAEIDAILAALASQATAMPQSAAVTVVEPALALSPLAAEPTAAADPDMPEVLSDPPADGEAKLESCITAEETEVALEPTADETGTRELIEPSEMIAAAVAEHPVADTSALEPIAAIDTNAADHADCTGLSAEAETAQIEISAPKAVTTEQQDDAAMLETPLPSGLEATPGDERPQQVVAQVDGALSAADALPAAASTVTPATEADEALADAAVISLHARQRKHKGALASGAAMPARANRHIAAKIAAGIVVLITAATLLVMADRTAFGGVPSLHWMTQTPSVPTGIDWLLQRIKDGAVQSSGNGVAADLPLDDGPLAGLAWGA